MYELEKTEEVNRLIAITKSDSGAAGPRLAQAHIELGKRIAQAMPYDPEDTTVVAILRGGIFFAEGIYFQLKCRFQLYDPKYGDFQRPDTKNIILSDSVIHTGKTIREILQPDMAVACCVIQEHAVPLFHDQLYTVRVSGNSFTGSCVKEQSGDVGPDTSMRLFNLL